MEGMEAQSSKALALVVRTLKERCLLLQRRLRHVEEENMKLSERREREETTPPISDVVQLSKENDHLTERLMMVACENNRLWKRLVVLTEDNNNATSPIPPHKTGTSEVKGVEKISTPQLIRSQTFTQTSPNPKLIAKLEEKDEELETSLEEISLKIQNSFIAEKSELVDQYEQMVELQKAPDFNVNTIGFTYLGGGNNYDSLADIKRYTDKLIELKNTALQQQADLKKYIANLESKKQEEKLNQSNVPKHSTDLSKDNIGIDSPETEVLDSSTRWATPANSTSYHDNIDDSSCSQNTSKIMNNMQNNSKTSSKNKDEEDNFSKIPGKKNIESVCPICFEHFKSSVAFEKFQKHVEAHFTAEDYNSLEEEDFVLPVQ